MYDRIKGCHGEQDRPDKERGADSRLGIYSHAATFRMYGRGGLFPGGCGAFAEGSGDGELARVLDGSVPEEVDSESEDEESGDEEYGDDHRGFQGAEGWPTMRICCVVGATWACRCCP